MSPKDRLSETAQKGSKMAKVIVVTSGKGGVGKTTTTAALGAALAQTGQSVVVVDFDVGLRNLDLVMGAERRVVFDLIKFADIAVLVTNPEVSSVRDSDRMIGLLDSKTEKAEKGQRVEKHILITRYDAARAARGEMLSIDDVLEILSTPLLGIIPESEEVLRASNLGAPVILSSASSAAARAYQAAARRLRGEDVPMSVPQNKKGLFDKLFGRRAA
jgi:septum site-determining protein MinD